MRKGRIEVYTRIKLSEKPGGRKRFEAHLSKQNQFLLFSFFFLCEHFTEQKNFLLAFAFTRQRTWQLQTAPPSPPSTLREATSRSSTAKSSRRRRRVTASTRPTWSPRLRCPSRRRSTSIRPPRPPRRRSGRGPRSPTRSGRRPCSRSRTRWMRCGRSLEIF